MLTIHQLAISFIAALLAASATSALAQSGNHGDGHAEMHGTYKDWRQPDTGGSCCNAQTADDPNGDCRPTTGYVGDGGWWRARVRPGPDGFVIIPPIKVLTRQPDGRCHICEGDGRVYCFAPCDPKS